MALKLIDESILDRLIADQTQLRDAFVNSEDMYIHGACVNALRIVKSKLLPLPESPDQKERSYSKEDLKKFLEWCDYPLYDSEQMVDKWVKETYPDKTVKP